MQNHPDLPLVSIITVTYNDAANLQKTITNIAKQDYPNLEYIVIDGGSKDESIQIIKEHDAKITKWVSEADKGIFEAMNKGVALANGEFINFMNAGDWFLSNNIISEVFKKAESLEADLVYGNHEVHYLNFVKKKKALKHEELWKHMIFSHQSLFTRKELLTERPFNLKFKFAADFHFIYNSYRLGYSFYNTDLNIAGYLAGGHSETGVISAYKENRKIVLKHDKRFKVKWFHQKLIAKQTGLELFKKLVPEKLYMKLMQLKNASN